MFWSTVWQIWLQISEWQRLFSSIDLARWLDYGSLALPIKVSPMTSILPPKNVYKNKTHLQYLYVHDVMNAHRMIHKTTFLCSHTGWDMPVNSVAFIAWREMIVLSLLCQQYLIFNLGLLSIIPHLSPPSLLMVFSPFLPLDLLECWFLPSFLCFYIPSYLFVMFILFYFHFSYICPYFSAFPSFSFLILSFLLRSSSSTLTFLLPCSPHVYFSPILNDAFIAWLPSFHLSFFMWLVRQIKTSRRKVRNSRSVFP